MRVFYVRPSDNGNYAIEAALATLSAPPRQVDRALFRGRRLPLEALNYDPAERGLAHLNGYDLVVLAGLDPVVLSSREHLALVAFVERGGALMLLGGTHSFGNAEGTYLPLTPILPVDVLQALDVEVNAPPRGGDHPIARGLPEPLGYIARVHPVEPRPGAEVALSVDDFPLVVAGQWGYGRVVVVASYPDCGEAEYGWFFTGDAFDDFVRAAVAWMAKERHAVWIDGFALPDREVATGRESFGKLMLRAAPGAEPATVQLTTRLTREGRVVHEDTQRIRVEGSHEALVSFRAPGGPEAGGLHYVAVTLTGPDGATQRRDVAVAVANPTRAAIEFEDGRRCAASGGLVRLRVHAFSEQRIPPREVRLDVALLDPHGQAALARERRTLAWQGSAYEDAALDLPLPRLRPGAYRVRAELRVRDELADVACEELHVVAPAAAEDRLPLIAEGGYHLDRPSAERAIGALAAAGVNVLSLPGPVTTPWGERPHRETMLAYAEETAARAGLLVAHHRRALVPGLRPSAPLEPCALAKPFRRRLKKLAGPILEAAQHVQGFLVHELAPQTVVRPEQLCRCPACVQAYRRSYGGDLPAADLAALTRPERATLCSFVSSYWMAAYSLVRTLRDELAPAVALSLPFAAASFLRDGPAAPYSDAFSWMREADVVDVGAEAGLAAFRLSLAGHRVLCAAQGKPFGALIDLGDRAPAPAEAAYTALAHGASSLRVAENPRFAVRGGQRPAPEALGTTFARIAQAGPLLPRSTRPPGRLALIFPFTQMVRDGTPGLLAAHELLCAAFGDVDLLHQRLATDDGLDQYPAVAVLGCRMLPARTLDALIRYVERGGLLLADSTELADEDGQAVRWPQSFLPDEEPVFEGVTVRYGTLGAGHAAVFSAGLAQTYGAARDRDDRPAERALRRAVADALARHGVRPSVCSDEPAVELGLRACPGARVLVAVNHGAEPRRARATLAPDAPPVAAAFDLVTGDELPVESAGELRSIALDLGPGDGGLWALYTERPVALRLELERPTVARGGELRGVAVLAGPGDRPVRSSYPLRITLTDPSGRPRPELGGQRVATAGTLELAVPIAVNEEPGPWAIAATEPLTGLAARAAFAIAATEPDP